MKIYTKTGDSGVSSISHLRLPKTHHYFQTLGSIDLLNSNIGILIYHLGKKNDQLTENLTNIQSNLMKISSYICGYLVIDMQNQITDIEQQIDELERINIELKNFILPQGNLLSVEAHNIRSLARFVERDIVNLSINEDFLKIVGSNNQIMFTSVMPYINRLSDYFFVLARHFNNNGKDDIIWKV
jgi:cob(I)alamin adenosyltransferase